MRLTSSTSRPSRAPPCQMAHSAMLVIHISRTVSDTGVIVSVEADNSTHGQLPVTVSTMLIRTYVHNNRLLFSTEFYDPAPHMRRVIQFISQQYPFWNATGGRDHVFWLARDKGASCISCSHVASGVLTDAA